MDRVARYPGFLESKARSFELLAPCGFPLLDLGCGLGEEVRRLDGIGIDPSAAMLREARRRGGRFVRGDGHALPFADATFAAVRADRVLQHVDDPALVVAELARVLRSGGGLVTIDPDQASLRIDGPARALAEPVEHWRATRVVKHGFLAESLPATLRAGGFDDVTAERFPSVLTRVGEAYGLATWARTMVDRGLLPAEHASRFDAALAEAEAAGRFAYRIDLVLVTARRMPRTPPHAPWPRVTPGA